MRKQKECCEEKWEERKMKKCVNKKNKAREKNDNFFTQDELKIKGMRKLI